MAGLGNWANAAVCQEITVPKGTAFTISMNIKADLILESTWAEIVILDTIPVTDADFTDMPIRMALNSWDCPDNLVIDGSFAANNCDTKTTLDNTILFEGAGDTTVVFAIKVGGGDAYNVMIDDVSVFEDPASVASTESVNFSLFPNPTTGELAITSVTPIQSAVI